MTTNLLTRIRTHLGLLFGQPVERDEPDDLVKFGVSHFSTAFPNPNREDCPSPDSLKDLIRSNQLPSEETRNHLFNCSECFKYYRDEVSQLRPHRLPLPSDSLTLSWRLVPVLAGALAILAVAVFLVSFLQGRFGRDVERTTGPAPNHSAASVNNSNSPSATPSPRDFGVTSKGSGSIAQKVSPNLRADNKISIDLESFSTRRAESQMQSTVVLPAARNEVTIELPAGSPTGRYSLSLMDPFTNTVRSVAATSDGTRLKVHLNLSSVKAGKYLLCVSRQDEVPKCLHAVLETPSPAAERD